MKKEQSKQSNKEFQKYHHFFTSHRNLRAYSVTPMALMKTNLKI